MKMTSLGLAALLRGTWSQLDVCGGGGVLSRGAENTMSDPVLTELSSGRLAGKALPHWGISLALTQIFEEQRQLVCWLLSGHSLSPAPFFL